MADGTPADGAFQAMDQMANWVRFADTKATILVAGLGVVLTMLMANVDTVVAAIRQGEPESTVLYPLVALTSGAFVWTVVCLLFAIGPRRRSIHPGINRFAWPTLVKSDPKALMERGETEDVREDAWRQVVNLAEVADRKFNASNLAIWGFGLAIALGALVVTISIAVTTGRDNEKVDDPASAQKPAAAAAQSPPVDQPNPHTGHVRRPTLGTSMRFGSSRGALDGS